jgi:hypothetical protein
MPEGNISSVEHVMKRLVCSFAVAIACLSATALPSRATTIDVPPGGTFSDYFVDPSSSVNFTDTYTIDMLTAGTINVSGVSFSMEPFTLSLAGLTFSYVPPPAVGEPTNFSALGYLGVGDYTLTVTGTAPKGDFSNYAGSVVLDPAPLPGTLALFVGGLGLLGLLAWHKNRKTRSTAVSLEVTC